MCCFEGRPPWELHILTALRMQQLFQDPRTSVSGGDGATGGQGNVDALLQLGDSHWYGRGAVRDWGRAAALYQTASKFRNAQALFNLGFMHEYGAGLPQVPAQPPLSPVFITTRDDKRVELRVPTFRVTHYTVMTWRLCLCKISLMWINHLV